MQSDPQFYTLFSHCPNLFGALAGIELSSNYRFGVKQLKAVQRTCDGLLESSDPSEPSIVIEFQVARSADIYPRIFSEMALYQLENPDRVVCGILIFVTRESDPKPATWAAFGETCGGGFRVLYLEEVLHELGADHPLYAVFQPFLVKDPEKVKQGAKAWYHTINRASLLEPQREVLVKVFLSWLTQIFKNMTAEDLMQSFGFETPVQETMFYKQARNAGLEAGREEGRRELERMAQALKELNIDPALIAKARQLAHLPECDD